MRELLFEYPDNLHVEIEWKVQPGNRVKPGDIIGVAESEKATQELEAFEPMLVLEIRRTARGYALLVDD